VHTSELEQAYRKIVVSFRRYLEEKLGLPPQEPSLETTEPEVEPCSETAKSLAELERKIRDCHDCPLARTRTQVVFGTGSVSAELMLVGEAPGKDEDQQGIPFVGTAGKLLNETLRQTGIRRQDVYIANILKCRPPGNRDPKPTEIALCLPYLKQQIALLAPRVICALGKFAAQVLLHTPERISRLRGKVFSYHDHISLVPTYHPAACIYNPGWRQVLVSDLMLAQKVLRGEISPPEPEE
jgi:DNA polymerase